MTRRRLIRTLLILTVLAVSALVVGCGARFYNAADLTLTHTPRSVSKGSKGRAEFSIEPRVWTDAEAGGHGHGGPGSAEP